jgi:uncharacterized protein
MLSGELLEILRCPNCAPAGREGMLDLVQDSWLVCRECGRKYPIQDDLPYMLVEIGEKWMNTPVEELPVPPEIDLGATLPPADEELPAAVDAPARRLAAPRWLLLIPILVGIVLIIRWMVERSSDCCDS